jgi:hypothetical protein
MIIVESLPETATHSTRIKREAEPLFDLQLLVARRADALARRRVSATRAVDRRIWLKAELEVFKRAERVNA